MGLLPGQASPCQPSRQWWPAESYWPAGIPSFGQGRWCSRHHERHRSVARAEKQRAGQEVWLGGDLTTFCSPKPGLPGAPRGPTEGKQREKVAFAEPHLDVFSGRGRLVTGNLGMLSPDASQPASHCPPCEPKAIGRRAPKPACREETRGTPCRRRGIPSPERTVAPTILLPGRAATKSLRPGRQGRPAPLGQRPEGPPAHRASYLGWLAPPPPPAPSALPSAPGEPPSVGAGPALSAGEAQSQPAG